MEDRRFNDREILKNHVSHGSISVIDDIAGSYIVKSYKNVFMLHSNSRINRSEYPKHHAEGKIGEQTVQLSYQFVLAAGDTRNSGQADPSFGQRCSRVSHVHFNSHIRIMEFFESNFVLVIILINVYFINVLYSFN